MIGTLEEAKEIFEAVHGKFYDAGPPGWKEVGSGSTRQCWLSPTGVVYKLTMCTRDGDDPNVLELQRFAEIDQSKLADGVRIPAHRLYSFRGYTNVSKYCDGEYSFEKSVFSAEHHVMAMQYIDGISMYDEQYGLETLGKAFASAGLTDTASSNAMRCVDGYVYIIDAGEAKERDQEAGISPVPVIPRVVRPADDVVPADVPAVAARYTAKSYVVATHVDPLGVFA